MNFHHPNTVVDVPVDQIHILNPRARNKKTHRELKDSIEAVGLKKPITISITKPLNGHPAYDLVCGQGRLEAVKMLGGHTIPALIVDIEKEDCYLLSLIENLARRHHTPLELLHDIGALSERGYKPQVIAKKTGLSKEYVQGILQLINNGEERLMAAVEREQMPISTAVEIASLEDAEVQNALAEAYQRNELKGSKLKIAMEIVRRRQQAGKKLGSVNSGNTPTKVSARSMVQAYERESAKQRALLKKADLTKTRLSIMITATKQLFADRHLVSLLNAEGLDTLPMQLADLIQARGGK
ncbi:MAG: ParB/RepB/Spo0J family partition protein [Kordiimonadaceae bacterium]|nr:ParB/RepB/Spo0J family partition protein [Kordiimonadaceae bacterium]